MSVWGVDVVGVGVYTHVTHVTPHMSPICNCHGCRFEKPQLEQRIVELERALSELVGAVEREHRPQPRPSRSLNVDQALRDAHAVMTDAAHGGVVSVAQFAARLAKSQETLASLQVAA